MIEKHDLQQVVPKSQATHWYDCVHVFGKNKFLTSGTYKTGKRKRKQNCFQNNRVRGSDLSTQQLFQTFWSSLWIHSLIPYSGL